MAPNLRVGIVYALNIGPMDETVDFISLQEAWVTDQLISEMKQQKIKLFVWTLNKDQSLHNFIRKNVNGVITDLPDMALKIRKNKMSGNIFTAYIKSTSIYVLN